MTMVGVCSERFLVALAWSAVIGVSSVPSANAQTDFLFKGDTKTYAALAPRVVCEGEVRSAVWTTDGSHIVVHRTNGGITPAVLKSLIPVLQQSAQGQPPNVPFDDPREDTLVAFSVKTGKSTVLWRRKGDNAYLDLRPFGPRSVLALIGARQSLEPGAPLVQSLVVFPVTGAKPRVIDTGSNSGWSIVATSDKTARRASALVRRAFEAESGEAEFSNHLLTEQGIRPVDGLPVLGVAVFDKGAYLGSVREAGGARWIRLDPDSGRIQPDSPPKFDQTGDFQFHEMSVSVKVASANGSSRILALGPTREDSGGHTIVASGGGSKYEVSPSGEAVFYTANGVALIRDIVEVPAALFEQQTKSNQQAETMSNAKQIGLAIIMFAADNDDEIPAGLTQEQIMPYLRNANVLNGFTYTFGGGKFAEIGAPAETELGFVAGSGGRAIIWADGHVTWRSD